MQKDKNEFISRVNDNRDIIQKICRIYCSGACNQQDLSQEIVYQLWKSYGSFRNESALSTWIYRVALNTAFQFIRNNKKQALHDSGEYNDYSQLPEDETEQHDLTKILYELINRLKAFDKALILLWLEKKSYRDISRILGISEKNVSVKLTRIKDELRRFAATVDVEL